MTDLSADPGRARPDGPPLAARLAASVRTRDSGLGPLAGFHDWFADASRRAFTHVERVGLDELSGWSTDPATGDLAHDSGRFFRVEGVDVHHPDGPLPRWAQPIINQPETGILGILVKEFDGVLHCLMQAKVEPGNINGLQLSPTVQATRSNYTRVHQGRAVPYLEYFRDPSRHRLITDVRQSEQAAWFLRKANRNMVVETTEDVELLGGFRWLTLGQLHRLLRENNVVNMDTRTVLSCLPFCDPGAAGPAEASGAGADAFTAALLRSCAGGKDPVAEAEGVDEVLRWVTEVRSRPEVGVTRVPLRGLPGWTRAAGAITHESGRFFEVIGVDVRAGGREVRGWTQPMVRPCGDGLAALVVKRVDGVLRVLVQALVEPGCLNVCELAPTVQCVPDDLAVLPPAARPALLDTVLNAPPARVLFDATLSEEGGRFHHALTRYLIVEADEELEFDHPDFRWMTVRQLSGLLRHSHYVNIQARSLVACLHSLSERDDTTH
ncbi:NDP-hexose 2,3-dehydratase family protein [Streptomyces spiramenti]|uniref:NDP-hexose 2,3-dehydratase n=1 Tax=Streptomyces spiramenti TaxID=2720606 RepID=A0ABX1AF58_9ACTN|nr:NDP-hexose 2,3-dehydratase family protein [Streptomyces spiramenti]NJP64825.1 NDP-hexose 2,3-dehydratase [Streptomyces spiramenti]